MSLVHSTPDLAGATISGATTASFSNRLIFILGLVLMLGLTYPLMEMLQRVHLIDASLDRLILIARLSR